MKKLALLALSPMVLWAANAEAKVAKQPARYTGFYYDSNPTILADLVEKSLRADSTGKTRLDTAKCRHDGSCATPLNYVESFNAHNPTHKIELKDLAAFLRSLQKDCSKEATEGVFQMDRIEIATGTVDINGMSRTFDIAKGECVWVDPVTHLPVLAQHCANPVGVRLDLDCVYVDTDIKDAPVFALIWARYNQPTDKCFSYRFTSRLFEASTAKTPWQPVPNGCLGIVCNLAADERALGKNNAAHGEVPITGTFVQFRLSRNELLVLCLKAHGPGGLTLSSFAAGVRWPMDYRLVGREWHARVYYESADMRKDNKTFNGPGGLVFYGSTREEEAEIQRLTQ